MSKMKVLLYKVGKEGKAVNINNTLKGQQRAVGGHIEVVCLGDNIYLTVNEEGKLREECRPNRHIDYRAFRDTLYGDFFITAIDDEGNNISLTPTEVKHWKNIIDEHTTVANPNVRGLLNDCSIKIYAVENKEENKEENNMNVSVDNLTGVIDILLTNLLNSTNKTDVGQLTKEEVQAEIEEVKNTIENADSFKLSDPIHEERVRELKQYLVMLEAIGGRECLNFSMDIRVGFNRPVDRDNDHISVGGFGMVMNGKRIILDFENSYGNIAEDAPECVDFHLFSPDVDSFPAIKNITVDDLKNISEIFECFVYTGEEGESDLKDAWIERISFKVNESEEEIVIPDAVLSEWNYRIDKEEK